MEAARDQDAARNEWYERRTPSKEQSVDRIFATCYANCGLVAQTGRPRQHAARNWQASSMGSCRGRAAATTGTLRWKPRLHSIGRRSRAW